MNTALTLFRLAQKHPHHGASAPAWLQYVNVVRERIGLFASPYEQWPDDQRAPATQALFTMLDTVGDQLDQAGDALTDDVRKLPGMEDVLLRRAYQRHRVVMRSRRWPFLVPADPVVEPSDSDRIDEAPIEDETPRRHMVITVGPVSQDALNVRLVFHWSLFRRKHAFDVAWAEPASNLVDDLARMRNTDQVFEQTLAGIAGVRSNWPGEDDLERYERSGTRQMVNHWVGRMDADGWRRAVQNPDLVLNAVREAMILNGLPAQAWSDLIDEDASRSSGPTRR